MSHAATIMHIVWIKILVMTFKYQVEIERFVSQGAELPALHAITDKESFRYVFADSTQQNHIPPHKLHPNRLEQQIKKGKVDLSGFALSNLETEIQAMAFYQYLHKTCKNVRKQIGDSLSFGVLTKTDGQITDTDVNGHFDLYESDVCDLNQTFKIVKPL